MKRIAQMFVVLVGAGLFFVTGLAGAGRVGAVATGADRAASVVYKKYCASCHGQDGRSKTFKAKLNHARDLTDAEWQSRVSDERIYNVISNGRGKMPGFEKKLSLTEIESLVTFVRGLRR